MSSIAEPAPPEYSFASPRKQLFTFPADVISRMLENPSSHIGLMKLYQTCKHFYAKRPILIADDVTMTGNDGDKDACQIVRIKINFPRGYKDVTRFQVPVWLTNKLYVQDCRKQRLPKLFRSSIKTLDMNCVDLQYDDFVLLVAEKNVVTFKAAGLAFLQHSNMSFVPVEEVLQHLPSIKEFYYYITRKCSLDSLIKLNAIQFNNKFEYVRIAIFDVDSTFDFNLFCEFFMKNCDANTEIDMFAFSPQILKDALTKLDVKWKTEAHDGLKKMFSEIEMGISDDEEEMEEYNEGEMEESDDDDEMEDSDDEDIEE